MLLESLFDFGIWLFEQIVSAMPSASPALYSVTNTLWDIGSFGVWVIGDEMWFYVLAYISSWLTFKMVWGVILFIYRLIPLT